MIDPALIARAQQLLNRARMIAEAPAQQYNQLGHRHAESSAPTAGVSTLQQVGDRINDADSDREMESAIRWGTGEIDDLQGYTARGAVPETRSEFHQRIVETYEGVTAPVVAARERCSVTEIRNARQALGRSGRYGFKVGRQKLGGQG